ncbi:MAG: FAD-binding protein [Alphaproteobacteria bacterium]|nr:FAD-binding protein [Alphaproteobacteria bacterium]
MSVLVIAEHNNKRLKAVTLNTIGAAKQLDNDIHILVAGSSCNSAVESAAKTENITKVLKINSKELSHVTAENIAPIIADLAKNYTHVLAPASTFGKNILPHAAALLDVQQISDISAIIDNDTFERPVYAGNAIATVKSSDDIKLITVRSIAFEPSSNEGGNAHIENIPSKGKSKLSSFVALRETISDRPELTSAKIIIAGGRGIGSASNFALIEKLANKIGAAVGASRAAVDAGYIPNDCQIGQTGKIVAPDLYIAIGISGAIQHLTGIKDSKIIVAINNDENAPIFQVADYGLVADLFDAVPELENKL